MKRQTALRKIRNLLKSSELIELVLSPKYYLYAVNALSKAMNGKKILIRETEYNDYVESQIFYSELQFDTFASCKTVWI